jgi:microcystin degradation protein MlrC
MSKSTVEELETAMTKRILIAGFKHETNTFSKLATTLEHYRSRGLYRGEQISKALRGTNTEIAAFLDACDANGWQAIPVVSADATPSGRLTRETYETIATEIVDRARDTKPDAVLLSLHGAMVAEHTDDGEGTLLSRLREVLGRGPVIGVTLDLHANVTETMCREADVVVSYKTYPHVDLYDTGARCAAIVRRALSGDIRPVTVMAKARMLTGADHGRTTAPGPMTELLDKGAQLMRSDPAVLDVCINAGFSWADIPEVGPTAVIVANGWHPRFAAACDSLISEMWESRHRETVHTVSAVQAIAIARAKGKVGAPVVIADFADNPGGGGYSDSPGLLRAMLDARLENAAISPIFDPESAAACHAAGVGRRISLRLAGKVDPAFGAPITCEGEVLALSDGGFNLEGPMARGVRIEMGPSAAVRVGGVDIVITSRRFQNYDRMYFKSLGIEPTSKAVLAVKSAQHFRAAYGPIASEIVVVDDGGGICSGALAKLPFRRVPRPMFPLDDM